jgi:hypothetical protein
MLKTPDHIGRFAFRLFNAGLIARVQDYAPYGAFITRLSLVYICAITKELLSAGEQDVADMQYLFYAPWCHVFASNDKLHRTLWPAVAQHAKAFFMWGDDLWGDDLKNDLTAPAGLCAQDPERVAGSVPIRLPGSAVQRRLRLLQ